MPKTIVLNSELFKKRNLRIINTFKTKFNKSMDALIYLVMEKHGEYHILELVQADLLNVSRLLHSKDKCIYSSDSFPTISLGEYYGDFKFITSGNLLTPTFSIIKEDLEDKDMEILIDWEIYTKSAFYQTALVFNKINKKLYIVQPNPFNNEYILLDYNYSKFLEKLNLNILSKILRRGVKHV